MTYLRYLLVFTVKWYSTYRWLKHGIWPCTQTQNKISSSRGFYIKVVKYVQTEIAQLSITIIELMSYHYLGNCRCLDAAD